MLNVALIGLGDVSPVHRHAIQSYKQARFVAACDLDPSKNTLQGVNFYTDYEEMLEKETIDCVHICLPHHLHEPVTRTCVEKGLHVFLEKPLAHHLQAAQNLVQLEKDYPNVKVCISLQNRFNETVELLMKLIEKGTYGNVTGIKGLVAWHRPKAYYDEKPWRGKMDLAGGGVMINQAIHTLDLMQLFGGEISSIRGSIETLSDYNIEVEDTATAKINFKNGATGLFFATIVNAGNSSVELEVTFENGKLLIKDHQLMEVEDDDTKRLLIKDEKFPGEKFYYGASHKKLIHHFYRCIQEDRTDYIHAKDAFVSIQMIEAIYESAVLKKPLSLPSLNIF